jgi:hypothetical protein
MPISTSPTPIEDFVAFMQLLANHADLGGRMIVGDIRRFLEETRSDLTYPLLWVEYPNMYLSKIDAGGMWYEASTGFTVLKNEEVGDHEKADLIWRETASIATDLVLRLNQISKAEGFEFEFSSLPMEPINPLTVANDFGWRVGFRIKRAVSSCINSDKWA